MTDFTEFVKLLTAMVSLITALVGLSKALKQGSKPRTSETPNTSSPLEARSHRRFGKASERHPERTSWHEKGKA